MPAQPPSAPPPGGEESIEERIARQEKLLVTLVEWQARAKARIQALRAELAASDTTGSLGPVPGGRLRLPVIPTSPGPSSAHEKVSLFRRLFRGRDDVFPRLWANSRSRKTGYAPACSNEWRPGICEKPRVRCGECPNQAFLSVTDQVILDHLRGRHVIGVYPLLADETCWFLAADFDESCWMDDVSVFVETARGLGVSAAVERSRSGNGAHVWFFFSAPVAAATARRMGSYILTETMSRRHQLAMGSYDRLFPNQDTMPRGGFGNLIALPLQHEPRWRGNTVFVDDGFVPYPDQWAYLASIRPIEPAIVEGLATVAARRGQVLGVRAFEVEEVENTPPWDRLPSRRPRRGRVAGPLPAEVRAVLAQRLFVEMSGLPSPLLNQIKRLAAFQNPEFYRKQHMRLPTAGTPRVITCAEETDGHIALPRACRADLGALLNEHGVTLNIDDRRVEGEEVNLHFRGRLTPLQREAVEALLGQETGIIVAPPGAGKTVVGAFLAAARGRSTLVLVHRRPLLDQWIAQLALFLGLQQADIGQIGGGRRRPNGRLDVAMLQSLARGGAVDDAVAGYGHVIVDECHHVPAVSFERVLSEVKARHLTGLTATPRRRDGLHPIAEMQLGPIRFAADRRSLAVAGPFVRRLILRETAFEADGPGPASIQEIYRMLAASERRNRLILDDVIGSLKEGRSLILLTERRDHLELLAERLRDSVRHLIVLRGGMTASQRRAALSALASVPPGEGRLLLATGRYAGEGFDDARLDTLFLTLPVSWRGTLVQYAGRLHRLHAGKTEVRIVDYVDGKVPMLRRMFEKRLRGYRAIGYACGEDR